MSIKKTTKEAAKKQKLQSRETIARKIDIALGTYKNDLTIKKYEKNLKKASKLLSKVVVLPEIKKINGKKTAAKTVAAKQ